MTKDTHTDNEEPSKGKCPYYNDDCPKCYPTKSSGELEEMFTEVSNLLNSAYEDGRHDQLMEAETFDLRGTLGQFKMYAHQILDALHTAQITKLPRPTDKLCFQCGGTLYQFDDRLQCVAPGCGSYQYLEREHKIGEDGE